MDDDDDFGDFGGFEAAEPAFPTVDEIQPNVEAGPSPWAILDTARSQVGMRPDLLCVQNQFPPVLDPTVLQQQTNGEVEESSELPTEPPCQFPQVLDNPDNNAASLVNDILDGSFNRTSEPNSLNGRPNGEVTLQAPDVQETDNTEASRPPTFHCQASLSRNNEATTMSISSDALPTSTGNERGTFQPFQSNITPAAESTSETAVVGGLNIVEVEVPLQSDTDTDNAGVSQGSPMSHVLRLDTQPKPVEPQLNLKQIQQESSDAVESVVQEYKTLMQSSLHNHEESVNNLLQKNNKERELQLELALTQQNKDIESKMQEMKAHLGEEIKKITQESVQHFQEEMKEILEKEKKEIWDEMQASLQKEKDQINDLVQEAVAAERERGAQAIKEQKDEFLKLIEEERKESQTQTRSLLEEQKIQFQETLKAHLEGERKTHKEAMDRVIELANQEMRAYLQQQREVNRQLHQRQYASLDVFLNGARQQLQLLMDSDPVSSGAGDNGGEKSSSEDKDSSKDT